MSVQPSFWQPGPANPNPYEREPQVQGSRMKSLTVIYVTSRPDPKIDWFLDSLHSQINDWEHVEIVIVDSLRGKRTEGTEINPLFHRPKFRDVRIVSPKPTIWQGEHRITKEDWWAASNARNTGICLARTDWIAFLDDRCVLMPTWLQAIRNAMSQNYAVCGTYEKRHNLTVENGVIKNGGIVTGRDNRFTGRENFPREVDGGYWYGCTNALPLEWALNVNGYAEDLCDGLSFEDIPFGMTLKNNHYTIQFDQTMQMIEDRSPGSLGAVMKRSDYGVSPRDKSHKVLEIFRSSKTSQNTFNIREVREKVLRGEPFPPPSASHNEWFTGRPISEL
jgi:glycosyltransferase involved in cell wall biosynthesis